MSKIVLSIATLCGTIIGVGFFSLPFVTIRTGLVPMIIYLIILGILVAIVHLYFSELSLRTPDFKRLPGFAKIYLGNWGEKTALIFTVLSLFGALLAYLIVGGEFLQQLLSPIFQGSNFFYTILYFFFGAILISFGIKSISKIGFASLLLLFLALILIFFKSRSVLNFSNLLIPFNPSNLFLPYGPILFSLWGANIIPEVEEMLRGRKEWLKRVVVISIVISILVYVVFGALIIGITGQNTTESALGGLKNVLGGAVIPFALVLGILTTFTAFISSGLTLKRIFSFDLKMKEGISFLIAVSVPFILYLLQFKNFISVISLVGGIALGVDGIIILLCYKKIKKRNILIYPLILIFLLGIIYETVYFLK